MATGIVISALLLLAHVSSGWHKGVLMGPNVVQHRRLPNLPGSAVVLLAKRKGKGKRPSKKRATGPTRDKSQAAPVPASAPSTDASMPVSVPTAVAPVPGPSPDAATPRQGAAVRGDVDIAAELLSEMDVPADDMGDIDKPEPGEAEVGVLKLPTYEEWKASREVADKPAPPSTRRRRRRAGGAAVRRDASEADEQQGAEQGTRAPEQATVGPDADEAVDERKATLDEVQRRRQLLLVDPSADVYAGELATKAADPEEYDLFSAILGEGRRTEVGNFFFTPYLQSGCAGSGGRLAGPAAG